MVSVLISQVIYVFIELYLFSDCVHVFPSLLFYPLPPPPKAITCDELAHYTHMHLLSYVYWLTCILCTSFLIYGSGSLRLPLYSLSIRSFTVCVEVPLAVLGRVCFLQRKDLQLIRKRYIIISVLPRAKGKAYWEGVAQVEPATTSKLLALPNSHIRVTSIPNIP